MDDFVDSSALVKRYVQETGSVWLSDLVAPATGNDIYIARITAVEVTAALTRRARGGSITAADASAACLLFRNDLRYDYEIVDMTETLLNRAMTLAETHGLRGYDAVQLAAACAGVRRPFPRTGGRAHSQWHQGHHTLPVGTLGEAGRLGHTPTGCAHHHGITRRGCAATPRCRRGRGSA